MSCDNHVILCHVTYIMTLIAEEQLKDDLNKAKELTRAGTDGAVSCIHHRRRRALCA